MTDITVTKAWKHAQTRLKAAGVDTSAIDARLLLERAFGVTRTTILAEPHAPAAPEQLERLASLLARREAREPLAYILGEAHFWTLTLSVSEAVLTPRPDTETVVSAALERLAPDASSRVLDLGTGSGALALAILSERPLAQAVGVDVSPAALAIARANAARLGVHERLELREGVWGQGLDDAFDLIVSNPPYIPTASIDMLEDEVRRYEPRLALDGGEDGLDAYRALLPDAARLLKPGGVLALEIGFDQALSVSALVREAGAFTGVETRRDLAGQQRVVLARRV
jgi:release factor glutamine methyltransferase